MVLFSLLSSASTIHAMGYDGPNELPAVLDVGNALGMPMGSWHCLELEEVKEVETDSEEDVKEQRDYSIGCHGQERGVIAAVWSSGWQSGYGVHSFLGRAPRPLYLLFRCIRAHSLFP